MEELRAELPPPSSQRGTDRGAPHRQGETPQYRSMLRAECKRLALTKQAPGAPRATPRSITARTAPGAISPARFSQTRRRLERPTLTHRASATGTGSTPTASISSTRQTWVIRCFLCSNLSCTSDGSPCLRASAETTNRRLFDLNSYFASVEGELSPELRGRPIVVVPVMADTTRAFAGNYEAKDFGVRTGTRVLKPTPTP